MYNLPKQGIKHIQFNYTVAVILARFSRYLKHLLKKCFLYTILSPVDSNIQSQCVVLLIGLKLNVFRESERENYWVSFMQSFFDDSLTTSSIKEAFIQDFFFNSEATLLELLEYLVEILVLHAW